MSVVIDGTTGISGNDGSAATPSLRGDDANTGVFFPAADTVAVATGGSERLRVDSSGNVGIGMSPTGRLSVRPSGTGSEDSHIGFGANLDTYITTGSDGIVVFREGNGAGVNTERMRIDANGNVGIGTSSPASLGSGVTTATISGASGGGIQFARRDATAVTGLISALSTGVVMGSISSSPVLFRTNNTERLRIDTAGQIGIGGANYGTSGQVLTSGGSGAAPSWAAAPAPTTAQVASATAGISYGAVGSYLEGALVGRGDVLTQNSTIAGSSIYPGGVFGNNTEADTVVSSGASLFGGSVLSGTWRVMGRSRSVLNPATLRTFTTLFLRIS
jgi:hypothetical protein